MSEFCRKEDPAVFEVRVGFVRVCLRDVRMFDVPNVVVMVEDMIRLICALGDRVGGGGGLGRRLLSEIHRSSGATQGRETN